jgi:hypothetical protein
MMYGSVKQLQSKAKSVVRAVNALHEDIHVHGILAARPAKES